MVRRVTIMIDDDNERRLRIIQAGIIKNENLSYSFSKVVNDILRKNLKK